MGPSIVILGTGQAKGLRFQPVEGKQKMTLSSLQTAQATLTIKVHTPEMLPTAQIVGTVGQSIASWPPKSVMAKYW